MNKLDAFYRPAEAIDVVRASAALDSESHGQVTKPYAIARRSRRPEGEGVLCERIFGPVDDHRCACGMLGGPRGRPPQPGERCPKCGVEATASAVRNERWAHISLPFPVLHPALATRVGEILDLAAADVLDVARFRARIVGRVVVREPDPEEHLQSSEDTGPDRLLALLRELPDSAAIARLRAEGFQPEALFVERVPVPPPGRRPLVRMPGGQDMPGQDTSLLSQLVQDANHYRRLRELDAPELILVRAARSLVDSFEALIEQASGQGPVPALVDRVEKTMAARPPNAAASSWMDGLDPTQPSAAAVLDEAAILLVFPYAALHLAADGRVLDVFATAGATLTTVADDGRFVLFTSDAGWHARELGARRWLDEVPASLTLAFMYEERESAYLVDPRSDLDRRLFDVSDYPALSATSRDARFLWVEDKEGNGGVYDTRNGLRVGFATLPREAPPILERDGSFAEDDDAGHGVALGLTAEDRFRFAAGGLVAEDDRVLLRILPPWPVVAFSGEGDTLLVVRRDAAALIDLDAGEVQRTWKLDQLQAGLRLDGLGRTTGDEREALLRHFGGAWTLARASVADIASVEGIAAGRARTLSAAAKKLRPARRIKVT